MWTKRRMQKVWEPTGTRVDRLRCTKCDNVEMVVMQEPVMKKKRREVRIVARCRICGDWERLKP